MTMRHKAKILIRQVLFSRWTRFLLGVFSAVFIAIMVYRYRDQIVVTARNADGPLFVAAVILGIASNFVTGLPFRLFLGQYGITQTWVQSGRLQLIAQVAKYIPGKVWGAILQTQISRSSRLDAFLLAGADTVLFQMLLVSATGIAVLIGVRFQSIPMGIVTALAGLLAGSAFANAGILAKLAHWLTGRFADTAGNAKFGQFLASGAVFTGIQFLSLLVVLHATTELGSRDLLVATSCALLAWVLGMLVFVFPSGLAIREAAFVALAGSLDVPAELSTLAAAALAIRASQLIQDVITGATIAPFLLSAEQPPSSP